jgi:hypothetical protein
MISEIILSKGFPISFFHAMYKHGMAQCLLLDRVRPGWKEEMRSKGMTQFALLEKEFPLDEKAKTSLAAEARNRFGYDGLLAEQKKLIDERLRVIREYVDAPGRLYRIYHNDMPGKFNWKPAGPVYHVPESLEKELAEKRKNKGGSLIEGAGFLGMRRSVWAGGISRLEKGGLDFQASDTPIIFGVQYLEWIDPKPAPDNSDMNIESESKEGDWYVGAKISTHGFVLKAEKARVEWSKDIVRIRLASK